MKKFFMLWLKILPLSLFVVWLFVIYLEKLDKSNGSLTKDKKIFTLVEIQENFLEDYEKQLLSCLLENLDDNYVICNKKILNKYNFMEQEEKKEMSRSLIYFIYFLLAMALNSQLTLYFYSKNKNNILSKSCFYISDWSINSAPILGVLGTITAFSILMANSQGEDITKLFGQSFFDSAITTLLGGFIYVFNLYLNINYHATGFGSSSISSSSSSIIIIIISLFGE